MSGIDSYSVTPATNATADGGALNYAEGQAPSTLNNSDRQQTADIRSLANDLAWFQYGTGDQNVSTHLAVPAVYASGTSFTIAGADVTLVYHVSRRVRAVGVSTGTIYGSISVTSYSPTTTTVTVVWDSGSLSNETLVISLSQIPVTGHPLPFNTPLITTFSGLSLSASLSQLGTLSIPPGTWELNGALCSISSSPMYVRGVFSDTTASASASSLGVTDIWNAFDAVTGAGGVVMPPSTLTLTATTTRYFNGQASGVATGFAGFFRASRIIG